MGKRPKQRLSSIIKNNIIMLRKIAAFAPDYFFWMIVEGIISGAINVSKALFSFYLLNAVGESGDFMYAVRVIAFMALFHVVAYAFHRWYWHIMNNILRQKLHLRMHEELFRKALSLDLACFDDPDFYNDFVWAMEQSDRRAIDVIENAGKLINRVAGSTTLIGLLLTVDPIIALILLTSSTISIVCELMGNRINYEHNKATNPLWRKRGYINRVYHLSDYAKELRISRASELLMKEYDDNNIEIIKNAKKYGKKYYLYYSLGYNTVGTVTLYALLLYMTAKLGSGALLIGGFAASVNVVWNIRWFLGDLSTRLTSFADYSLYIEKYLGFMRMTPSIKGAKIEIPEFESLEFKNVSFSYEFSDHPEYKFHDADHKSRKTDGNKDALKGVDLSIRAGEKIAIVGYNGAGKTTLIKLIMRLYDPTEGEILYNGINIKEFDPGEYRKRIGTVFQDFKIFATSIAENVMNGIYNEAEDRDTVLKALDDADFTEKLESLAEGIDTHLTREFNEKGTNLSGGESQKIAIARVFAKHYPLVIMDEPSSALDPIAEYNLNQSILNSTADKTVIFISHRLSTTRIADKIYMFDTGRLIESGSHTELLEMDGKYAEMFRLQSEKYQNSIA